MASLASRNIGRLLPRLLKAAERQRHLSSLTPLTSSRGLQQHQKLVSTSLGHRSLATAAKAQEVSDDGWRKEKFVSAESENLDRLLYSVDLAIRRQGRVMEYELDRIFRLLERTGVCSPNQALLVIKCCGEVLVDLDRRSRGQIAEKCFSLILGMKNTPLDITHYNALLKIHHENRHPVKVPEFLAELEELGLPANRVTYQTCVALYCQQGDIAGATTILQHMKQQDLAINEAVFHSLLSAHAANRDPDSVTATLDVMAGSGLPIGAEAYTVMISSYGLSGQWDMVSKTLEQAEVEGVKWNDADILAIILACTEGGLADQANTLLPLLPKHRGYFQEIRNFAPQLALNGNIRAAVELYTNLKNRDNFDKEGQARFLVNSVAKANVDVEQIFESVRRLEEDGFTSARQFLIQEAAYNWSEERCVQLAEFLDKENNNVQFNKDVFYKFMRLGSSKENHKQDANIMLNFLKNLHILKVKIPEQIIASDVIPSMYDPKEQPSKIVRKICTAVPNFKLGYISNAMLVYLLNAETNDHFNEALGLLLNVNIPFLKTDKWNSSLARSYLYTRDVDNTVTFISAALLTCNAAEEKEADKVSRLGRLGRVLNYIGKQAHIIQPETLEDDLISAVLQGLVDNKIGLPVNTFNAVGLAELEQILKTDAAKELLKTAGEVWEEVGSKWSQEDKDKFYDESRQKLNAKRNQARKEKSPGTKPFDLDNMKSKEEYEEVQDMLRKSGKTNHRVAGKLLDDYLKDGDIDKALDLVNYTDSNSISGFTPPPTHLEKMIELLVKKKKPYEARDLVVKGFSSKKEEKNIYHSGFVKCAAGLAEVGDHKSVMDFLETVTKHRGSVISSNVNNNNHYNNLLSAYVEKGDVENLQELFTFLVTNDFIAAIDHLGPLVEVYLNKEDLHGAVAEFSRLAKLYKKTPKKFALTCRLIEENEGDLVQEVHDISIEVTGREMDAIYDLAHSFIAVGKREQAKSLFDTPGLRCFQDKLHYYFDQLKPRPNRPEDAARDAEKCEMLVAASRNISGCDRNMLFQKLVEVNAENPDKVEDIWLQTQEESLIPSTSLMIAIANVLQKHGRNVPFEAPSALEIESTEVKDSMVYAAIKVNDFESVEGLVMNAIKDEKKGNLSLKCKRKSIDFMLDKKQYNRAAKIATALATNFGDPTKINFTYVFHVIKEKLGDKKGQSFFNGLPESLRELLKTTVDRETNLIQLIADNKLDEAAQFIIKESESDNPGTIIKSWKVVEGKNFTGQCCELFKKWQDKENVDKMREFIDTIGPNVNKFLKADLWYKTSLINVDPDGYVDLVKTNPDKVLQRFMINNDQLLQDTAAKHPSFKEKLEQLAQADNAPATLLMARLSLQAAKSEQFLKYFEKGLGLAPQYLPNVFEKIDTMEKLEISLNAAGTDEKCVKRIFENCLKCHKDSDKVEEIRNMAASRGVELHKGKRNVEG